MDLSKLFKRKPKQDKSCKNCKYYKQDDFYVRMLKRHEKDSGESVDWLYDSKDGMFYGDKFAKCVHPKARWSYISTERDTNWLDSRLLRTCSRGGRRFEPNLEKLANILRQK